MQIDKLNTALGLTANIGVIIGLLFVVFELRQNQTSLDASIRLSLSSAYQEMSSRPVENRDFAEVIVKGFTNVDDLELVDRVQLMNWISEYLQLLYATYELRNSGVVSENLWLQNARYFALFFDSPGFRELYEQTSGGAYPVEFLAAI